MEKAPILMQRLTLANSLYEFTESFLCLDFLETGLFVKNPAQLTATNFKAR
jgi:hypothetical protein